MILGANFVFKLGELNRDFPADVFLVLPGRAELGWFWVLPAIRLSNTNGCDAGIDEGEDQIARRYFAHGLVERIPCAICIALRRPEVTALNLMAVGLVLVDPPVAHRIPPPP